MSKYMSDSVIVIAFGLPVFGVRKSSSFLIKGIEPFDLRILNREVIQMVDDEQMLNSICETADMGRESLKQVLDKTNDGKLKRALRTQISEYDNDYNSASELLRRGGLKEGYPKARPITKAESQVTVNLKTAFTRNKESQIAEMVIRGSSMGVVKITKELNDYNDGDQEIKQLAEKHLKTEQNNIEEMKRFL